MKRLIALVLPLILLATTVADAADFKSTGNAQFDAAVKRGVEFLKGYHGTFPQRDGHLSLIGYALLKAGESHESGLVKQAIDAVLARSTEGVYRVSGYEHIYISGVDAMLLADSDPDRHRASLQAIADYIVRTQHPNGSWSDGDTKPGDVSMSQYGVLGLWAAQRAGCNVPAAAFDKAARFHLSGGNGDGGFGYRPGTTDGPGGGASTRTMTLAGAGSLSVARLMLHGPRFQVDKEQAPPPKFGVLVAVQSEQAKIASAPAAYPNYNAQASASALDSAVGRAIGWESARFNPVNTEPHTIYYYYCLERAAALNDIKTIGNADWFSACGNALLAQQLEDGSWDGRGDSATEKGYGTAFAILFYMRSTGKILGKQFGAGIMLSGRDLPTNFADGFDPDAKKKKRDPTPLGKMLGAIASIDTADIELEPEDVVASVQFGDPEELVGQIENLKNLLKHKDAENRRIAYWALGRTGELELVPLMLEGLRDANVDVAIEARNALRYISRKPNGLGVPDNPFAGVELGTEAQKLTAANNWRNNAVSTWRKWYFSVRPYDERDGLDELELESSVRGNN